MPKNGKREKHFGPASEERERFGRVWDRKYCPVHLRFAPRKAAGTSWGLLTDVSRALRHNNSHCDVTTFQEQISCVMIYAGNDRWNMDKTSFEFSFTAPSLGRFEETVKQEREGMLFSSLTTMDRIIFSLVRSTI